MKQMKWIENEILVYLESKINMRLAFPWDYLFEHFIGVNPGSRMDESFSEHEAVKNE